MIDKEDKGLKGIITCEYCGVRYDFDVAKEQQYDWDRRKQRVNCPCCKEEVWRQK